MPFLDRMGYVFLILAALMIIVSLVTHRPEDEAKAMELSPGDFRPGPAFMIGFVLFVGALAALYAVYW